MRYSTLSTTEVYGHLVRHLAHQAVDAALTTAERELPGLERDHPATTADGD